MKNRILLIALVGAAATGGALFWSRQKIHPHVENFQIQKPVASPAMPPADLAPLQAKAAAGDPAAQTKLGWIYEQGQGVRANMKEAAKWFQHAADQKYPAAEAALGEMIQAGQGMRANPSAADRLFRMAAEEGNTAGQYDLAYSYEQGLGVKQDEAQAARWYELAAMGGDRLAQLDIGQRYELGLGVKTDLVQAYKWLTLASDQGQSDAGLKLQKLKSQMSSVQIAEGTKLAMDFVPRASNDEATAANQ